MMHQFIGNANNNQSQTRGSAILRIKFYKPDVHIHQLEKVGKVAVHRLRGGSLTHNLNSVDIQEIVKTCGEGFKILKEWHENKFLKYIISNNLMTNLSNWDWEKQKKVTL